MTPDERRAAIRKAILTTIRDTLVRETVIQTQLADAVHPSPTAAEIRDELTSLEGARYVTGLNPAMGGPTKWISTDLGRSALHD